MIKYQDCRNSKKVLGRPSSWEAGISTGVNNNKWILKLKNWIGKEIKAKLKTSCEKEYQKRIKLYLKCFAERNVVFRL